MMAALTKSGFESSFKTSLANFSVISFISGIVLIPNTNGDNFEGIDSIFERTA